MARQKREIGKTGIYHILLRGVNALFYETKDYDEFISVLKKHIDEKNIRVISYLLLQNRIHLVIDANGEDIGKRLKPITTSYARYLNRTRSSSGKLFYDRFKSEPIDSKKDLKAVISFVNAIAVFADKDYAYSSLVSPLCNARDLEISKAEQKSTDITAMFIEDYDCLSKKELSDYITAFCGVSPKEYKNLSPIEQDKMFKKLTSKFWISKAKVCELLEIKKQYSQTTEKTARKPIKKPINTPKTDSEPEIKKPKKKDLNIWLL